MPLDLWTPMNTNDHSLRNKSVRARNKVSHMWNFCEGLRGLCRDMLWLWSIKTNNARNKKIFCLLKKRAKPKTKKRRLSKSGYLFLIKYRMRYAIYMPPDTKDLVINQTMVAYGNRQTPLRSLKHLMETRLNPQMSLRGTQWKPLFEAFKTAKECQLELCSLYM